MSAQPLRVVIADDHPVFRDGLAHLIGELDGIEVVAVAANGQQVVDLAERARSRRHHHGPADARARRHRSDPADHGRASVDRRRRADDVRGGRDGPRRGAAGARGYLLKDADEDEIATVLRGVARGEAIFGPGTARVMLDHLARVGHSARHNRPTTRSRN